MKLTFTKSAYELPDGKYLAKFTGVTMKEATGQIDKQGNVLPPGMTWDFQIAEGDQTGKKVDRLTGRTPTPKNGCGKFLAAITDTLLKDGQEVDLGQFTGCLYRITVEDNRVSYDTPPARVYDHPSLNNGRAADPAPAGNGSGPPPRKKADKSYWFALSDAAEPKKVTVPELKQIVETTAGIDITKAEVCPDGTQDWTPITVAIPEAKGWVPF